MLFKSNFVALIVQSKWAGSYSIFIYPGKSWHHKYHVDDFCPNPRPKQNKTNIKKTVGWVVGLSSRKKSSFQKAQDDRVSGRTAKEDGKAKCRENLKTNLSTITVTITPQQLQQLQLQLQRSQVEWGHFPGLWMEGGHENRTAYEGRGMISGNNNNNKKRGCSCTLHPQRYGGAKSHTLGL